MAAEGHARVPSTHRMEDGFALGGWVRGRRQGRKRGRLSEDQVAALDAMGFVWDRFGEDFARGLAALQAFVADHGHARVPQSYRTQNGFALGSWVNGRRQDRRRGGLTEEQVAVLDALGLVWDPRTEHFPRGLAALQEFVADHGHARVPQSYRTVNGFDLGAWPQPPRNPPPAAMHWLGTATVVPVPACGQSWGAPPVPA